jgi:AAHS family 4-hydroxybenzoate transporter-like MFS transporter
MLFIASGVGTLAIAAVLLVVLPESPKLLLARGDHARLAAFCARANVPYDPEWTIAGPPPSRPRLSMLAPLAPRHRFATFVFAGLYTLNAFALYMLQSWLPTILPLAGFALAQGARLTALLQLGGLIGGLLLSFFLDRNKTVAALAGAYALVALALAAFGVVPPTPAGWGVLLLIVGGGIAGAHLAIMAVGTSFYPPHMLSTAIGLAVAVARLGAIAGPFVGAALIDAGFGAESFLLAMLVPVLLCGAGVLLIPAARRTPILET